VGTPTLKALVAASRLWHDVSIGGARNGVRIREPRALPQRDPLPFRRAGSPSDAGLNPHEFLKRRDPNGFSSIEISARIDEIC
jgi:hypothetical protein